MEILGKLVSKERARLNHVHEFFDLISVKFSSTKMLTQGPSSSLIFLFLHLISYTQSVSFFKKTKVIYCRVKSTRLGFEFRRLHNDFLPRVWGRGRNRTTKMVPEFASTQSASPPRLTNDSRNSCSDPSQCRVDNFRGMNKSE